MNVSRRVHCARLLILLATIVLPFGTLLARQDEPGQVPDQAGPVYRLFLPMLTASEAEFTLENPAATADWTQLAAPGITLRHPATWSSTGGGGMTGFQVVTLRPPQCAAGAAAGCAPMNAVVEPFIRISVQSLGPGFDRPTDYLMDMLERDGYARRRVLLGGQSAWLLEPGSADRASSDVKLVLQLEGHDYLIERTPGMAQLDAEYGLLRLLLGTLDANVATAPPPPLAQPEPVAAADTPPVPAPGKNALALLEFFAEYYGPKHTNTDDCYIAANAQCNQPAGILHADGAHFIDCLVVLTYRALGRNDKLSPTSCSRESSIVGMQALHNAIMAKGGVVIDEEDALPGDMVFLSDPPGAECWGGVITAINVANTSTFHVAFHSNIYPGASAPEVDTATADITGMECVENSTPTRQFVRLFPDTTAPVASWVSPLPGPVALRLPLTLTGTASDDSGLIGQIAFSQSLNGDAFAEVQRTTAATYAFTPELPCQQYTFRLQAFDPTGNPSLPVDLALSTTLVGDADLDTQVTAADDAALWSQWEKTGADSGFNPRLDLNADNRIDAGDQLMLSRLVGDSCR